MGRSNEGMADTRKRTGVEERECKLSNMNESKSGQAQPRGGLIILLDPCI